MNLIMIMRHLVMANLNSVNTINIHRKYERKYYGNQLTS